MREAAVLRRYHVTDRDDYAKYNKLVGAIGMVCGKLKAMKASDPQRAEISEQLLRKLYALGLIDSQSSLAKAEAVSVSAFCRRRLPVVMVALKMAENVKTAVTFVQQGHIRVGPDVVNDPAFLVPRNLEDYVTWTTDSKIRRHIAKYNGTLDDFDLMA